MKWLFLEETSTTKKRFNFWVTQYTPPPPLFFFPIYSSTIIFYDESRATFVGAFVALFPGTELNSVKDILHHLPKEDTSNYSYDA